jgi:hypothetical protein
MVDKAFVAIVDSVQDVQLFFESATSIRQSGSSLAILLYYYTKSKLVANALNEQQAQSTLQSLRVETHVADKWHDIFKLGGRFHQIAVFAPGTVFKQGCESLFSSGDEFVVRRGHESPIDASLYVVQPTSQVYVDYAEMEVQSVFTAQDGWREYGLILDWRADRRGQLTDWTFPDAQGPTGKLYWYFMLLMRGEGSRVVGHDAWDAVVGRV